MESRTVFVYNSPDFLRNVSKKGTESDITIHHRKDGDTITTFMEASRYPEKLSSLTDCVYVSDIQVLNGSELNSEFGEVILALDLMRKDIGYFLISDDSQKDRISKVVRGTVAEKYEFFNGNPMELMDRLNAVPIPKSESGSTAVIIDHFFKVKSVGTVVLGFVLKGTLERHQKLFLSGTEKEAQVKSIQMHDEDQELANTGARVGLALKNVDAEELERGQFLTSEKLKISDSLSMPVLHPMIRQKLDGDMEVFVSDRMRYQRGFIEGSKVRLEKGLPVYGEKVLVSNPNLKPRILGLSEFN